MTINFRLGIFGFFGYPGLDGSGTFGLQDQQAALQWVQRNIAAFGGDPGNVTLFGESWGAFAASAQLTSAAAAELFHRVALQSGSRWRTIRRARSIRACPRSRRSGRRSPTCKRRGRRSRPSRGGSNRRARRPSRSSACAACRCAPRADGRAAAAHGALRHAGVR
ncbi:carboxylesterase family protein [Sorangium sp. So ce362]|uniref:carboxylesterase family protein n=1 Tax=Sorangium sp. So ce362 TaxID=3133303 RepID=UPI003F5E1076